MTRAEAKDVLLREFISVYGTTTPVAYENNEAFIKPTDAPWVRFLIQENTSDQKSIGAIGGRKYRRPGLISYQVFIPNNTGTYEGNLLCEKINDIFEGNRFGEITCWTGSWIEVGINSQDLYQFNGSIQFEHDQLK